VWKITIKTKRKLIVGSSKYKITVEKLEIIVYYKFINCWRGYVNNN